MRKLIATLTVILAATAAFGQWQPNDPAQSGSVYYNGGNVGIGTATPSGRLSVFSASNLDVFMTSGSADGTARLFVNNNVGNGTTFYAYGSGLAGNLYAGVPLADLNMLIGYGSGFVITTNSAVPLIFGTGPGPVERMRITGAGNVGIGTGSPTEKLHVVGNATFTGTVTGGNIAAQYQDLAEWVPSGTDLTPGTVVVLDTGNSNTIQESHRAYDSTVAGVVSAQPGLILGNGGEGKEMVATTGRVKVRVDATKAPIQIGDLLVTGNKPGTAMRSAPITIQGQPFHRPGTIIGKALEPLANGEGEILVLLSMQ
ncbi:MAG: hypothetical protein WA208_06990 [Thermoanaerobaculia bacterium]